MIFYVVDTFPCRSFISDIPKCIFNTKDDKHKSYAESQAKININVPITQIDISKLKSSPLSL